MKLRLLKDDKSVRRGTPSVAINGKLGRLTMNKHAYKLMSEKCGRDFTHIHILLDDDNPGTFYLKSVEEFEDGAKKLDKPSPGTRSLQVSLLLAELNWQKKETTRFSLIWNDEVKAGRVDINET